MEFWKIALIECVSVEEQHLAGFADFQSLPFRLNDRDFEDEEENEFFLLLTINHWYDLLGERDTEDFLFLFLIKTDESGRNISHLPLTLIY